MMAIYIPVNNTCNRCGECCGGDEHDNPWPATWYKNSEPCWRNWTYQQLIDTEPHAILFGVIDKDGTLGPTNEVGSIRVTGPGGGLYYYVWIENVGPCKDTSTAHDGSSYITECPFLQDDPGDGTRPCGLQGTNEDGSRLGKCELNSTMRLDDNGWAQWQADHANCSIEVVEE